LRKRVKEVKPALHVFGHIHGDPGAFKLRLDGGETVTCVNAASITEMYNTPRTPFVVDLVRS